VTEYVILMGVVALAVTLAVGRFGASIEEAFRAANAALARPMTTQVTSDHATPARTYSVARGEWIDTAGGDYASADLSDDVIATGSVTLSWAAPASRTNGEALDRERLRFKIYFGIESGNYFEPVDVGSDTTLRLAGLEPGDRYYFAVSTYDERGNESALSKEISKLVTAEGDEGGS
jgi:hypothetical protein